MISVGIDVSKGKSILIGVIESNVSGPIALIMKFSRSSIYANEMRSLSLSRYISFPAGAEGVPLVFEQISLILMIPRPLSS